MNNLNKVFIIRTLLLLCLIVKSTFVIAAEHTSFSIGGSLLSIFSDDSDTEDGICNSLEGIELECIKLKRNDIISVTENPSKEETRILMGSGVKNTARFFNLKENKQEQFLNIQRIRLFDDSSKLSTIGGMTEIAKGSGIYITAAHVLKSYGIKNLSEKTNKRGLIPRYYTFTNSAIDSLTEDLVFIKFLSNDAETNDDESINIIREWINRNNTNPITKGEKATLLSYSRTKSNNELDNLKEITISSLSADGKYIIIPTENQQIPILTKSSSGSLILQANKTADEVTYPTAIGLVQCIEKSTQLIYALDLSHLTENETESLHGFSTTELNTILDSFNPSTLLHWPEDCLPIDGRGG